MLLFDEIAKFVHKLSRPAQFHPSTIKTSNLVLEISILVQFRPCAEMACHSALSHQRTVILDFQLMLKCQFYPILFCQGICPPSPSQPLSLPGSQDSAAAASAAPHLAVPLLACSPPPVSLLAGSFPAARWPLQGATQVTAPTMPCGSAEGRGGGST